MVDLASLGTIAGHLLVAVVTAVVSGYVVASWTFRSQRVWEKRAAAYERLIGYLYDEKEFGRTLIDFETTEDRKREIQERAAESHIELLRLAATSSFLLSKRASAILRAYLDETDVSPSNTEKFVASIMEHERAASSALMAMIATAKKDLRFR